jgi:hypothetical protein
MTKLRAENLTDFSSLMDRCCFVSTSKIKKSQLFNFFPFVKVKKARVFASRKHLNPRANPINLFTAVIYEYS